jgi:hypothetical protein
MSQNTKKLPQHMHETGGLVGGLAEEGGELAPVVLVAAAGGAEAGEEGGGLDEGVVCRTRWLGRRSCGGWAAWRCTRPA